MSACRSCGKAIIWTQTETGKSMPVDVRPVANGNVELRAGIAHVTSPNPDVHRYVSHFVTCPHATAHRKKRSDA